MPGEGEGRGGEGRGVVVEGMVWRWGKEGRGEKRMAEVEHVERRSSALYSTICIAYRLSVMCRGGGRRCDPVRV